MENVRSLLAIAGSLGGDYQELPYSRVRGRKYRAPNNVGQREATKLRNRKANKVARESRKINGKRGRH